MKALKWIAIVLGVVILIAVLVIGWLGFLPGLSRYIGPNPRDLGVELTFEHARAAAEAHNMPTTVSDLETILADPEVAKQFDTVLTSDQASSLLLTGQESIPNWPLRFTQIRFNDDGTSEASGVIRSSLVRPFLGDMGVPAGDIDTALGRVPIRGDVVFYASGSCGVQSNTVDLSLSQVKIGRLTVPGGWYQGKEAEGTKYIDGALAGNGFQVDALEVSGGTVHVKGTRPLASMEPWLHIVSNDRGEE
ncbi:MAG: hypothetical protein OEV43_01380 [Coriobacteriia bacterium]|nr:hypothetical protein [Coriobacteriia bacterium]